jgi:hypothetical protein
MFLDPGFALPHVVESFKILDTEMMTHKDRYSKGEGGGSLMECVRNRICLKIF